MICTKCGSADISIDEKHDRVVCEECGYIWTTKDYISEMSPWERYRKKPIETEFREVLPITHIRTRILSHEEVWGEVIKTQEGGLLFAYPGTDYILRGTEGEIYPMEKEIFEKTFDVFPTEDSEKGDEN